MTNLFLPLIATYAKAVKQTFIQKTRRTMPVQERFLLRLLRHHRHTELGRQFHLGEIQTLEQFRDRVPIWPYSTYQPYTERIAQGETNILTPDPVKYINLTSGSTGKQKLVPVTQRFQRSLGRANLAAFGFSAAALQLPENHARYHQPLKLGRNLTTNSARIQGYTCAGIPYGPVTVGSLQMGKPLWKRTFAQPFEALMIADSRSRHYVCLLFALGDPDLRGIAANFPMLVLRTCNYLSEFAEALIQDLGQGTLADWLDLDPALRAQLERQLVAYPDRAQHLQRVLQTQGRLTPKLAWPGLSYVLTAMGGTSDFYLQSFPTYFGNTPVFGGVYGTAEATFGVYPDFNTEGSILAIESGFYEFVPSDQWDIDHPQTLLPTEVKVGEHYRILVTSYSGFYRYDIGDVVQVVGFFEQAPLITFRFRQGGLLSATTEKTTEFHATQVMQTLQQEFNIRLEDFCITLSEHEIPAHYLVNIELGQGERLENPPAFLERFEYWLAEFNRPYGDVRKDQVPPPRLRILAPGSFAIVRQRQVAKGMSDSQLKIPHINEDRTFLGGLKIEQEFTLP
jgi:hypothetical protein